MDVHQYGSTGYVDNPAYNDQQMYPAASPHLPPVYPVSPGYPPQPVMYPPLMYPPPAPSPQPPHHSPHLNNPHHHQNHQNQQQQQQVVVIGASHHQQPVQFQAVESYCCQIVLSCFVFWCCNLLFGLIAFILAMVASDKAASHRKDASKLGKASCGVSIAGIVVTVVAVAIVIGVYYGALSHGSASLTSWIQEAVKSGQWGSASLTSGNKGTSCIYTMINKCYNHRSYAYTYSNCLDLGGYYASDGYCYY